MKQLTGPTGVNMPNRCKMKDCAVSKKYTLSKLCNFFENENFNTRALVLTFFLLPKIYLISSYIPVFEICKKYYIQYITPPYCTVEK